MFNLFPFTNFHDLNMDWIIKKVMSTVQSVNGRVPDENGNVTIPQVEGVTSVCNIGPDGQGNVEITPADVGALPDTVDPVESINSITPDANGNIAISARSTTTLLPSTDIVAESGVTNDYTRVNKRDIGIISLVTRFTTTASTPGGQTVLSGFPSPASGIPMYFIGVNTGTNDTARFFINTYGHMQPVTSIAAGQYEISGCYIPGTVEKISIVQT